MTKRSQSIIRKLYPLSFLALLLFAWWLTCEIELVPAFMLPSPGKVLAALWNDAPRLWESALVSLQEAMTGLMCSIAAAFLLAVVMDRFRFLHQALYPVLVVTQTIPTIAIAPLLVLWLGYGTLPKVVLVFSACFFPLVVGVLSGFASVDRDVLRLMNSMGATRRQILFLVKLPASLESFFAGLRISAAYSIVSAVVAEWLGGEAGLGVYMTRVRKAYAFDKMFAVIFLISVLSLVLMKLVDLVQRKMTPWKVCR
ncbi:MAG: ABC transporter permease [Clostridiales bacterium]|nr:ABC transporter permease [Clostridiales bacterium]